MTRKLRADEWALDWDCCQECGTTERAHQAKGLCWKCYQGRYEAPAVICAGCGQERPHHAHGLCKQCYMCQYDREGRPIVVCVECGKERAHAAHGLCGACCKRQWDSENRERVREYKREYHAANPEPARARTKRWRKANPDKRAAAWRRRWARKQGVAVELVDEAAIYKRDGYMCLYCGATEDLTLDHIMALDNSGPHREDNLLVACRRCNSSKGAKPLEDWLQTQPRALAWVF